jgi:hypothetical protein
VVEQTFKKQMQGGPAEAKQKMQDGRAKKCKAVEQKSNKKCKTAEQKNARPVEQKSNKKCKTAEQKNARRSKPKQKMQDAKHKKKRLVFLLQQVRARAAGEPVCEVRDGPVRARAA